MSETAEAHRAEAVRVLSGKEFRPVRYRDRHAALAERLGLDFPAILTLLDHVPLCLDGEPHARSRRAVARLMASRKSDAEAALPDIVARGLAGLGEPGSLDVMTTCVGPMVDGVLAQLVGADIALAKESLVSRVFSQTLGVAQRRRMEGELGALLERLESAFPEDAAAARGARAALAILGRDALTGTLARSLHAHFEALDGARLSRRPLAIVPSHTGVPYIDREARAPVKAAGRDLGAGDLVRCHLTGFEGAGEAERLRFFGAGAHVCLGKPITLRLFEEVSRQLSAFDTRVRVASFRLRRDDVFLFPESFEVEVSR